MIKPVKFTLRMTEEQSKQIGEAASQVGKTKNDYILECVAQRAAVSGIGYVKVADIIEYLTKVTVLANQLTLIDREPYEVQQEIFAELEKIYAKFN